MKSQDLSGVRILDLSRVLAGPLCTMMLGDLGADVIKVERPKFGDDTRGWGPPFASDGQSAYFTSVNRNKFSVSADLDSSGDRGWLRGLMLAADVVVENFLPGALARKGLDAVSILAEAPQLIWCTISGFGADSQRPGYDFVVQAECGWMSITGPADGAPHKVGLALADVIAGKDAAVAILAALVARGRGEPSAGERQLHIALRDSATAALINVAQNTMVSGEPPSRWGNAHPNLVPYELFRARDRDIVIAVGNDRQWADCAAVFGLVEHHHASPVPWSTNAERVVHRATVVARLATAIATDDAAVWMRQLAAVGVPCGLVRSVPEALTAVPCDPVTGIAPATGGSVRWPPPQLNEHGKRLRQHGWRMFDKHDF